VTESAFKNIGNYAYHQVALRSNPIHCSFALGAQRVFVALHLALPMLQKSNEQIRNEQNMPFGSEGTQCFEKKKKNTSYT
jgi:hypothetical protein